MTESQLKSFILYCQTVETLYQEWKNYWLNYYINDKNKDLYDPFDPIDLWSKKQKEN